MRCLPILGLALITALFGMSAQRPTTGTLGGRVTDRSSSEIPGVEITAKSGSVERRAVTDGDGHYELLNLPPGQYAVTAFIPGFHQVTRAAEISRGRRRTLDFSLPLGCFSSIDPPLRVYFPLEQVVPMADAIAHVRILEVRAPQQLVTDDGCYYVRPHIAQPIRLINARRQPGDGQTFRFYVSGWDAPLFVGDEVITFLSHEESRIYYEWGERYRMTFSNGRLNWTPPDNADILEFKNGEPVEEVWQRLRAFRRRQPARQRR